MRAKPLGLPIDKDGFFMGYMKSQNIPSNYVLRTRMSNDHLENMRIDLRSFWAGFLKIMNL